MADKVKIKRYDGLDFVEFYPLTTHDQIIASGTASSTTFLRGDGVWATPVVDTATNADKIQLTGVNNNATYFIPLVTTNATGYADLYVDSSLSETFRLEYNTSLAILDIPQLAIKGTTKNAGVFYGGITNPSNTNRVNYDGNIHATAFIGDGSGLTNLPAGGTLTANLLATRTASGTFSITTSNGLDSVMVFVFKATGVTVPTIVIPLNDVSTAGSFNRLYQGSNQVAAFQRDSDGDQIIINSMSTGAFYVYELVVE